MKLILMFLCIATLSGCSGFQLGTVLYCAKDTQCAAQIAPIPASMPQK